MQAQQETIKKLFLNVMLAKFLTRFQSFGLDGPCVTVHLTDLYLQLKPATVSELLGCFDSNHLLVESANTLNSFDSPKVKVAERFYNIQQIPVGSVRRLTG